MPQISIIIPTYNRPRYLKRSLDSILRQTFKDYEIIVVQNGPFEYAETLVRKLARRNVAIRYLHVRKADPANARNAGVQAAKGEWIAFLDDDDEWMPLKLQMQVNVFRKRKDVGLVACAALIGSQTGSTEAPIRCRSRKLLLKTLLTKGCLIRSLSCVLVRKVCMDRAGGFDSKYKIANDYDIYLRLTRLTKLWQMGQPLVRVHRHRKNLSNNTAQSCHEVVGILQKLRALYRKPEAALKSLIEGALEAQQYLWEYLSAPPDSEYTSTKRIAFAHEIRCLKHCVELMPAITIFRHQLTFLCQKAGRFREAKAQARKCLESITFPKTRNAGTAKTE